MTVPTLLFLVRSKATYLFVIILFDLHPLIITWPNIKTGLSPIHISYVIKHFTELQQWKTVSEAV